MILKTCLPALLLALAAAGHSQPVSFTAQGNAWRVEEVRENPNNKFNFTFLIDGDTAVQGVSYRKWYRDQVLIGLLREDSLGTVFLVDLLGTFYGNGPNQELELYKFGAQVGDSTVFWRSSDNRRIKHTVIQIDSLEVFGQKRKSISTMPDDPAFWFGTWIEGIGSYETPLLPLTEIMESGWTLLCFNGINPDGFACTLSIPMPATALNFRIRPNPATRLAEIALPDGLSPEWIRVFDVNGKLVLHSNVGSASDSSRYLDVSNWPNGVYQVQTGAGWAWPCQKLSVLH